MSKRTTKKKTASAEPTATPPTDPALEQVAAAFAEHPASAFGVRGELRRIMSQLRSQLQRHMTSACPVARQRAVAYILAQTEVAAARVDVVISAQLPEAHR